MPSIVSDQYKFIYVHIRKTGGTSLSNILQQYGNQSVILNLYQKVFIKRLAKTSVVRFLLDDYNPWERCDRLFGARFWAPHANLNSFREVLPPTQFNQYYKFGFVRNTWDYLVSLYHYDKKKASKNLAKVHGFDEWATKRLQDDRFVRKHSQRLKWVDKNGKFLADFVGEMRTFEEDVAHISSRLGISFPNISRLNSTGRGNHREYYTSALAQSVAVAFDEDIRFFGFEF